MLAILSTERCGLRMVSQTNPQYTVNHLPFRAYCLIWNEWFRDQNLQDPVLIDKGDSQTNGRHLIPEGNSITFENQAALQGANLLPVNKYFDYFTGALPEPQKGPDVLLPLGNTAPVITMTTDITGVTGSSPSLRFTSNTPINSQANIVITPTGTGKGTLNHTTYLNVLFYLSFLFC